MYQSTNFYVPDIDELDYFLDPDKNKYHRLDREGIKLLFSYAMDVWPTDNEVSSTICTTHLYGGYKSSGCELSNCKGSDVVFVLLEKYCDGDINNYIKKELKPQYPENKLLFIIISKEASPKVSKNVDNIIYLDYSDFLRWRHDCELMSLMSYWADCHLESPKDYLEFAEKTKIAKEIKDINPKESIYNSFIEKFANSIQLLQKEKLINKDSENMKIIIKKDKSSGNQNRSTSGRSQGLNLQFIGLWCWGMWRYIFNGSNRPHWDIFEDTFIDKDGYKLGKEQIRKGHENYNKGYLEYLKKKHPDVVVSYKKSKESKNRVLYETSLSYFGDYLGEFCIRNRIPVLIKKLLLNILSGEKK